MILYNQNVNLHEDDFPISYNLRQLYESIWNDKRAFVPRNMLKRFYDKFHSMINIFEQNDVNEFFSLFIDKLNMELGSNLTSRHMEQIGQMLSPYTSSSYDIQRKKMDAHWYNYHKRCYSPLIDLFNGQLVSQIVCGDCKKIHHNYEIFANIMLPVEKNSGGIHVTSLLDTYFAEEVLNSGKDDTSITWKCDACKNITKSKRTIRHWRNPRLLVITLKRFDANMDKINTDVDIPETLDMSKYTIGPSNTKYELKAVAYHSGSAFSGHYIAMLRCEADMWFIVDDEAVTAVRNYSDGLKKGYMYFYQAC
jgi:ubiquitin C-terminal hydrolase